MGKQHEMEQLLTDIHNGILQKYGQFIHQNTIKDIIYNIQQRLWIFTSIVDVLV